MAVKRLFSILIELHLAPLHLLQLLETLPRARDVNLLTLFPCTRILLLKLLLLLLHLQLLLLVVLRQHLQSQSAWFVSCWITVLFGGLLVLRRLDVSIASLVFDVDNIGV